jgi:hypothetical protein
MWRLTVLAILALVVGQAGGQPPKGEPKTEGTFVVHEWGTFLSVQGSDGVSIGGMVESEEPLPKFVINRGPEGWERAKSRAQRMMYSKMETPVTYFYTDRPRIVGFKATMPKGLLTHWYPTVQTLTPEWKKDEKLDEKVSSSIDWGRFWIDPTGKFAKETPLPAVSVGDPWQSLRQTDAAVVRFATGRTPALETEKFLFYRGLGTFEQPLHIQSSGKDANLYLRLHNESDEALSGAFVVWVERQNVRWAALGNLAGKETRELVLEKMLSMPRPVAEGLPLMKQAMSTSLVSTGLYPKEASAMVDHWEKSYFTNPGLRVLYTLPRKMTDAFIPIEVSPKPTELVRTMVGRVEVLTPETEKQAAAAVERMNGTDMRVRKNAEEYLANFGRVRSAVLRRVAQMEAPAATKAQAEQLLEISVPAKRQDRPTLHNFIKDAVLNFIESDHFPPGVARDIAKNDANFVEKCSICWAVRDALETHGKTPPIAANPRFGAEFLAQLKSPDQKVRFEALRRIVEWSINQHFDRLQLSNEDKKLLEEEMKTERKRAMEIATSYMPGFQFCPSCDGACRSEKK